MAVWLSVGMNDMSAMKKKSGQKLQAKLVSLFTYYRPFGMLSILLFIVIKQ